MMTWKIGPALATGNTVILKPSELTPLTALRVAELASAAGFPPGVLNVLVGYGKTAGVAISEHMQIDKVAFTGSTVVGRKIMEAAARSNLKNVTLELGGKSPNVIFDDADMDQAIKWASHGILCVRRFVLFIFAIAKGLTWTTGSWNQGQTCCAGSRIYVQSGIYDKFLELFTAKAKSIKIGNPFSPEIGHGPQVSQGQFDVRVLCFMVFWCHALCIMWLRAADYVLRRVW
jgi:aldehyde dehydrogenase (NAD+)